MLGKIVPLMIGAMTGLYLNSHPIKIETVMTDAAYVSPPNPCVNRGSMLFEDSNMMDISPTAELVG